MGNGVKVMLLRSFSLKRLNKTAARNNGIFTDNTMIFTFCSKPAFSYKIMCKFAANN